MGEEGRPLPLPPLLVLHLLVSQLEALAALRRGKNKKMRKDDAAKEEKKGKKEEGGGRPPSEFVNHSHGGFVGTSLGLKAGLRAGGELQRCLFRQRRTAAVFEAACTALTVSLVLRVLRVFFFFPLSEKKRKTPTRSSKRENSLQR